VVFVDGVADKSRYRSFKVRGTGTEEGSAQGQNDDFASMFEVLGRRFRRALDPDADVSDDDPWALPDLVVIDGGKGQLGRVLAAMQDLGVAVGAEGVDVVALAKERRDTIGRGRAALQLLKERRTSDADEPGRTYQDYVVHDAEHSSDDEDAVQVRPERVYVPRAKDPIVLRPGSSERYLMERVRDEAHRFAITHHRKRRGKRSLHSALDDIEGVGPALKRALVQHFGSIAAIRRADPETLEQVRGIGPALARRIHETLAQR
jgi:excinuclease ABC subunit C